MCVCVCVCVCVCGWVGVRAGGAAAGRGLGIISSEVKPRAKLSTEEVLYISEFFSDPSSKSKKTQKQLFF